MYVAGVDLGSTTGKVIIMDENKKIVGWSIVRSAKGPQKTAEAAGTEALQMAGIDKSQLQYIIGTGYGRNGVSFINDDISEITCHARGASYLQPAVQTIIDIGGQDCKVISLDSTGKVIDFSMNDKCAAGTGRFFEAMARVLDCTLEELADYGLLSDTPCSISKQCSVFAESEVISLVNDNVPLSDISAGIHDSIARRIHSMAYKMGIVSAVALTGGCAQNKALVKSLEKRLKIKLADLGENPQITGALGAALFAIDRVNAGEA